MGMLPTANRNTTVMPVGVAAVKPLPPMPIQKHVTRKFCMLIKNAVVCAASRVRLVSHVRPCPVGSKKSSSASSLKYHPARPGPRGSHFHDTGTGRTVVVCAQKSPRLLDVDCPVPQDTSSGGLCSRRSEQKGVSTAVGGHPRQLSCWSLLHGFLGSVSGGHPGGAAHSSGETDGRNRPRGALE
jgi:hypothetical protein